MGQQAPQEGQLVEQEQVEVERAGPAEVAAEVAVVAAVAVASWPQETPVGVARAGLAVAAGVVEAEAEAEV